MNSEYFEPIRKKIKSKVNITRSSDLEYYIYDEEAFSHLCISPYKVTYKGYVVPLNESDLEDIYNMAAITFSMQEEKNKKNALDELKGELNEQH